MIDTYLKSKNRAALDQLRGFLVNVTEAVQGRAAFVDEEGSAVRACGDPDYFYVCIRAPFPLAPFGEIEACSVAEGEAVCPAWAS